MLKSCYNWKVVDTMKDIVINNSLNLIKNYNPDYNEEKIEIIEYGLVGLYLMISKTIIIFTVAAVLGIFKDLLILTILYNIIRMPSFGMHATKSWICLVASSLMFIGGAYLCSMLIIPTNIKVVIGIIGIVLMGKNSPADTEKRPIINSKRRLIYKIITTIIAITFVALAIIIPYNFLANSLIFALIYQCIMVSPTTYKIFNQPYNNYKKYTK